MLTLIRTPRLGVKPNTGRAALNHNNPLAADLLNLFLFNEAGGVTVFDLVRGRIGAITGNWAASKGGAAGIRFNGTSDQILSLSQPSGNFALSGGQPYSVGAIVKADSVSSGAHSVFESGNGTVGSCVQLRRGTDDWEFYHRFSGAYTGCLSPNTVQIDRTQTIFATYDNAAMKIYVDGLLQATATHINGAGKEFHGENVYIGAGVGVQYWDGLIEMVATWNRALTPSEVLQFTLDPYALIDIKAIPRLRSTQALSRTQEGYRFRNDDGDEDAATWLVAQDTDIARNRNLNTRLRVLTDVDSDPPSEGLRLQFRKVGDPDWQDVN